MQALAYLDLSRKKATETLGGSVFRFPSLTYGEDVTLAIRFAERLNGETVESSKTVQELRASIGRIDARPELGKFQILVGDNPAALGTNLTAEIPHNAKASTIESALNALTVVGTTYGAASVELKGESWLVTFDGEGAAVPLEAGGNSLFPLSFLRVRASELNGEFVHDLRLIQAPIASTDQSARVVPPAPTVTTLEDGSTDETGTDYPETQKLFIPPSFRGVYQIRRGFRKTGMLDRSDDEAVVAKELNDNLTEEDDELFECTLPSDNTFHISFKGALAGINHDPLEIEVFDAPEGDLTFTLDLNTPELHALLRKSEKVTLPIEIEADIEDDNDDSIVYTRTLLRDTVTIERELHFEELSTVASIDWQRPPLPKSYVPFTADQVSNGQIHYATADFGDGSAGPYVIDHNLDTPRIDVTIYPNSSSGEPLKLGTLAEVAAGDADFGFSRVTDNSLEVTFASGKEPAYNDYLITVLGLEQTSFFDTHTHTIEQIVGLRAILDDLGNRVSDLENRSGTGKLKGEDEASGQAAHWQLPSLFEVFPSRKSLEVEPARLVELNPSELGRARGLLAAVHDATTEDLPSTIPTPADDYIGRVFENNTGGTVLLPGGKGIRSSNLKAGEFAACDGRLWYPVTRYGEHASGVTFATDYASDANELAADNNEFPDGTIVNASTTDTLPAPLDDSTDYEILNRTDDTVELTTIGGETPITLTDDGVGTHTLTKKAETSYYPTAFERELFRIAVNERQLRLKKRFELRFALELAVLKSNTSALWSVAIEVGEKTKASTPLRTGRNLDSIIWRGTPLLEQEILVSPLSTVHRLGMKIERTLEDAVDTLTATSLVYGATEGAVAPKSANFALRARLIRFDTEDGESDPEGFVALRGFTIDTPSGETPATEGTALIN
jgi:hypothetical protein